jgi:hypothetical protein
MKRYSNKGSSEEGTCEGAFKGAFERTLDPSRDGCRGGGASGVCDSLFPQLVRGLESYMAAKFDAIYKYVLLYIHSKYVATI